MIHLPAASEGPVKQVLYKELLTRSESTTYILDCLTTLHHAPSLCLSLIEASVL
jgi:hypothetical protein